MTRSATFSLDEVDRRLVRLLQDDGRASVAQLSRDLELSEAATRVRVRALLDSRAVSVKGIVHASILGVGPMAIVGMLIDRGLGDPLEAAGAMPEVTFLVVTAGRYDVLAEVRAKSDDQLLEALDRLRAIDGVVSIETGKYLHVAKDAYGAPSRDGRVDVDEADLTLLAELEADGRATYATLASQVQLSQAAVRARVRRLIEEGAVRVAAIVDPMALGVGELCGFGVTASHSARTLAERIAALPEINFVAAMAGRWDVIGTLSAASDEQVLDVLDRIRDTDGTRTVEAFAHLAVVKEEYQRLRPR